MPTLLAHPNLQTWIQEHWSQRFVTIEGPQGPQEDQTFFVFHQVMGNFWSVQQEEPTAPECPLWHIYSPNSEGASHMVRLHFINSGVLELNFCF